MAQTDTDTNIKLNKNELIKERQGIFGFDFQVITI